MFGPHSPLIPLATSIVLAITAYLLWIWPFQAARKSPASDITRIRARMDGEGHRIVEIVRDGSEVRNVNSAPKAWRKYRVVTEYPDGSRATRVIGVHCTFLSEPDLVIYKDGVRQGLWTWAQAGLP